MKKWVKNKKIKKLRDPIRAFLIIISQGQKWDKIYKNERKKIYK